MEIINHLFVSDYKIANNLEWLNNNQITHIINTTKEIDNKYPDKFEYFNLELSDSLNENLYPYLDNTYKYIDNTIKQKTNILIFSVEGKSRSISLIIYYLMNKNRQDFRIVYSFIKRKYKYANINKNFKKQLSDLSINPVTV